MAVITLRSLCTEEINYQNSTYKELKRLKKDKEGMIFLRNFWPIAIKLIAPSSDTGMFTEE